MVTKKDRLEMLRAVPLFGDLSRKELGGILDTAKEVEHDPGDEIVREGATGVGFHLILEGQVRVTRGGRTVARLGPGDFFGEIALLDGGPRTATVTAESALRTLSLTSWEFRPLVEGTPSLAYKLLVHLCGRLRDAERGSTRVHL